MIFLIYTNTGFLFSSEISPVSQAGLFVTKDDLELMLMSPGCLDYRCVPLHPVTPFWELSPRLHASEACTVPTELCLHLLGLIYSLLNAFVSFHLRKT